MNATPVIKRMINAIKLEPGQPVIVLVREGSALARVDRLESMANTMSQLNIQGLVVVATDLEDIRVVDQSDMAAHGWVQVSPHLDQDSRNNIVRQILETNAAIEAVVKSNQAASEPNGNGANKVVRVEDEE